MFANSSTHNHDLALRNRLFTIEHTANERNPVPKRDAILTS